MDKRLVELKNALEGLHDRYASVQALAADPICVPRSFSDPADQELAAWVAAHLAYGRVAPMIRAIRACMAPLGTRPAQWLRSHAPSTIETELRESLRGWVWRFHTADDLIQWLLAWRQLDEANHGNGLEVHLLPSADESPDDRFCKFIQILRKSLPDTLGIRFFLPDPNAGSACKRWRMFMRWVVRREWPDLGLWQRFSPADLVIPVDTHVARFATLLGLTDRKRPDGKMAQEITRQLASICPEDPLRYDFALAHLGILGDCPIRAKTRFCDTCLLQKLCTSALRQPASAPY